MSSVYSILLFAAFGLIIVIVVFGGIRRLGRREAEYTPSSYRGEVDSRKWGSFLRAYAFLTTLVLAGVGYWLYAGSQANLQPYILGEGGAAFVINETPFELSEPQSAAGPGAGFPTRRVMMSEEPLRIIRGTIYIKNAYDEDNKGHVWSGRGWTVDTHQEKKKGRNREYTVTFEEPFPPVRGVRDLPTVVLDCAHPDHRTQDLRIYPDRFRFAAQPLDESGGYYCAFMAMGPA